VSEAAGDAACPRCRKPPGLCVCDAVEPIANRVLLVILQHPQEQDRELGSAQIAALQFARARLVVGLSWRGLAAIIGRPADPKRWGVLYLGPVKADGARPPLMALSQRGVLLPDQHAVLAALEGIVLLDGNWGQAKALWWRNPWLLKLRRLVLAPPFRSHYGRLRQEPRPDSLSTIEAAALCLAELEGDPTILPRALKPFLALLARYKAAARTPPRG
jgi:DTW domain-containing protein YfiP